MKLWFEVARRSFRRSSTYRVATISGVFVNTVFGFIRAAVFIFIAEAQPGASVGGMTANELATFAFVTQGFIMVTGAFGDSELGNRVRTGDVAIDFYRPVDIQLWWSAIWSRNTAFQALGRGIPPMVIGSLIYDLVWPPPQRWPSIIVALASASAIGFLLRFSSNLISFWLLDIRGIEQLLTLLIMFFSGMLAPLNLFPEWLEPIARWLPFAAMMQLPAEVLLGKYSGIALLAELGRSALWVALLAAASRLILRSATRAVVIQGG